MRRWGSELRIGHAVATVAVAAVLGVGAVALEPAGIARADDPALVSESFETTTTGLPPGWVFAEYAAGVSQATVITADGAADVAADGTHYLQIVSPKDNHARVELPVTVVANTVYRFHAMIRASGTNPAVTAAVLGVDGQTGTSTSVTGGDWTAEDLYVQTGAQTSVTFTLGLGNFGQVNHGRADFDAVTLTRVDAAQPGVSTITLPGANTAGAAGAALAAVHLGETMRLPKPNGVIYPLAGLLIVLVVGAGIYLARRPEESVGQS